MTTNSNNFLKTALAILLLSNSVLLFYIFRQEQSQKKQNSELININKKLDLIIKNKSENQSERNVCLNVFIEDEKTQELKSVKIKYMKEVLIDSIEEIIPVEYIEAPKEDDLPICGLLALYHREAEPKEGIQSFYKYINKNLTYPINAKRQGIEGKIMVNFVVDRNGDIIDVKAENDIGGGCAAEAERVIKNSPKWNPAKQRGKSVKTKLTIPIIFKLEEIEE